MSPMSVSTQRWYYFALLCHHLLLAWVLCWQLWLSPHPHLQPITMALVWSVPLLLPLRGMFQAKPYTFAWANFIIMLYFLHAFTLISIPGERILAIIELILVSSSFVGNVVFARQRGKEIGTRLKRLSQVEKEEKEFFERTK